MSYTTNSEPAQGTKSSMQASAGGASTGSVRGFLGAYTSDTAVSESSMQRGARVASTGSASVFPRADMLGTTTFNAIPIDDGPGPLSAFIQGMESKKRKREAINERVVINISDDSDDGNSAGLAASISTLRTKAPKAKSLKRTKKSKNAEEPKDRGSRVEKRLRQFRKRAPYRFQDRLERATTQPMFLINRERKLNSNGTHEVERFDMAGTTGNIYEVTIDKVPKCTCMDATVRGNQCKHIIYVSLVNVLKAPRHLQYQEALLSTELKEIFECAPVTPQSSNGPEDTSHPGKRKPVEDDCPVCVMLFKPSEEILWCKAACGNNIHKTCFDQWAKSKPGPVKCVYCRTFWVEDENISKKISKHGRTRNHEGYINVASEFGLSGVRDHSSYQQPWFDDEGFGGFGRFGRYD